ncbi:hypothetical protein BD410DRAFT_759299 [Rickenella mellea]|uniref:Glutathione S-transferase n=1 Tax=Rickenella mellea TaxID=50990 RepID=A0A4V3AZR3_9AGAM|nr:hypothetical protein BD410DRAFT_759299 [Rickenella mellea]
MSDVYTLFHAESMGSVFTLAVLRVLDVKHNVVLLSFDSVAKKEDTPEYHQLVAASPLAQFPTVIAPDGTVLTEGAAIALYLHDKYATGTQWSTEHLSPSQLALYYRIMVFIPANIYPTFTALDFPARFVIVPKTTQVSEEAVCGWVEEKAKENNKATFKLLEKLLDTVENRTSAFALGTGNASLVDIYITLMAHYGPPSPHGWMEDNCPKVMACARETLKDPVLQQVFEVENKFAAQIRGPLHTE